MLRVRVQACPNESFYFCFGDSIFFGSAARSVFLVLALVLALVLVLGRSVLDSVYLEWPTARRMQPEENSSRTGRLAGAPLGAATRARADAAAGGSAGLG